MKKKTFGRRHTQSGFTHSESPAAQIDPATPERLIAELAEQARNGGARERAELEQQMAEWAEEKNWVDYGRLVAEIAVCHPRARPEDPWCSVLEKVR